MHFSLWGRFTLRQIFTAEHAEKKGIGRKLSDSDTRGQLRRMGRVAAAPWQRVAVGYLAGH
jgi:hypothetical protein